MAENSFGNFLKEQRKKLGLSIAQTAKEVGITEVYLTRLEKGLSVNPSLEVAYRMAQLFNISLEEMAAVIVARIDREVEKVWFKAPLKIDDWRKMTVRQKGLYLSLLKSLIAKEEAKGETRRDQ